MLTFNDHSRLKDQHAFLSASKYHWIRYDEEKLINTFHTHLDAVKGTRLHAFAAEAISLRQRLQSNNKTLNRYVNDAIKYRMTPEQILFYSINAFGTADAVKFHKRVLEIADLKTGKTKPSMDQLRVYAAFFCLEYDEKPHEITTRLRIYYQDDVMEEEADPDEIAHIMDRVVTFDRVIEQQKEEAML